MLRVYLSFREVFADEPVGVLVGAALPRGMSVGEIHRKIGGEGEGGVPGQLGVLIAVSDLRRCGSSSWTASNSASFTESASWPCGSATGRRYRLTRSTSMSHGRFARLADEQVAFPVAGHLTASDLGGPVFDRAHSDDLRACGLLPSTGFALLTASAQDNPGTRQLAFRLGAYPRVNCLMRYGHARFSPMGLIAQSARYLLRQPAFLRVARHPAAQFQVSVYLCSFGWLRDSRAAASAFHARYATRAPCRAISRDTTDSSRPVENAISLLPSPFRQSAGKCLRGLPPRGALRSALTAISSAISM